MRQLMLEDATRQLGDLVEAALHGEMVLITNDHRQTIRLVPLLRAQHPRPFGSARGLIHVGPEFDEPLDDFNEYTT